MAGRKGMKKSWLRYREKFMLTISNHKNYGPPIYKDFDTKSCLMDCWNKHDFLFFKTSL